MDSFGSIPDSLPDKVTFFARALVDPFIILSMILTLMAGILWMGALKKFELSYAYPFISLSFVLIFILSIIFFREAITVNKIVGLVMIVIGIIILSRN
jgi:uncharacterized membrane protein